MQPTFWRISPDTVTFLECPLPIACAGGEPDDVVEATDDYAINGGAPRKAVPSPKPTKAPTKNGPTSTPRTSKPNSITASITASIWRQMSWTAIVEGTKGRRWDLPVPAEVSRLDYDDTSYNWAEEGDRGRMNVHIRRLLANPIGTLLPLAPPPPRRALQSSADTMTFGCAAAYMVHNIAPTSLPHHSRITLASRSHRSCVIVNQALVTVFH